MELLVMNDTHLTKYDVSYDQISIEAFLQTIINNYGDFCHLQRKAKNEDEILLRYAKNGTCENLKFIKECEDNTKVHKGRKRVPRKTPIKKYLYSFTAISYPEIYYTINKFLDAEKLDFTVFDKFVNPDVYANFINSRNYTGLNYGNISGVITNMNLIDEDCNQRDEITRKRKEQGECLRQFYDLFTFRIIEEQEIDKNPTIKRVFNRIKSIATLYNVNSYLDPANKALIKYINDSLPHKEIIKARENYDVLEKIKSLSKDEVKSL